MDRDFGELIFRQGLKHEGVLCCRLPGADLQTKVDHLDTALAAFQHSIPSSGSVNGRADCGIAEGQPPSCGSSSLQDARHAHVANLELRALSCSDPLLDLGAEIPASGPLIGLHLSNAFSDAVALGLRECRGYRQE